MIPPRLPNIILWFLLASPKTYCDSSSPLQKHFVIPPRLSNNYLWFLLAFPILFCDSSLPPQYYFVISRRLSNKFNLTLYQKFLAKTVIALLFSKTNLLSWMEPVQKATMNQKVLSEGTTYGREFREAQFNISLQPMCCQKIKIKH